MYNLQGLLWEAPSLPPPQERGLNPLQPNGYSIVYGILIKLTCPASPYQSIFSTATDSYKSISGV